jgi:AcrR family transcriptional regulator
MTKTRLDAATVVNAAAELLNREGPEALTLGRLATMLGVQTPSLYNHVDGLSGLRRELARLNAQRLAEELTEAAIGKSGVEALTALAQAFRAYIKTNPGLYLANVRASASQPPVDERLQAAEERIVRIVTAVIESFGLKGDDALHAARAWRSAVHGFASLEVSGGFGLALDCDESFRRLLEVMIHGLQAASSKAENT